MPDVHRARPSRSWNTPCADPVAALQEQRDRLTQERHRLHELAGQLARLRGAPEELDPVDAGDLLGRRHDVPQLERALVLAERLDECPRAGGGLARLDRGLERARQLAGLEPVVRDLRQVAGSLRPAVPPRRRRLLEMLGNRDVEPPALVRQDGLGRSLGRQRVPELVALDDDALVDDEELGRDGLLERVVQLALVHLGELGEQIVVDLASDHRRHPEQPQRRLRDVGEACLEHLAERRRQSATLDARGDELLGEERVALGALVDRRDQARPGRMPQDRVELAGNIATVEPSQLDPLDAGLPVGLGEPEQQRVAARELVAPERDQQQQALRLGVADEEREELPRRVVRPVQVLDGEHDRSVGGEPPQQVEEGLVHPAARPFRPHLGAGGCGDRIVGQHSQRGAHRGQRPARHAVGRPPVPAVHLLELADVRPEGLDDRRERQRALREPDATAEQHDGPVGACPIQGGGEHARLADPRLAAQQDGSGTTALHVAQGSRDHVELLLAPDQFGADDSAGHGLDHTAVPLDCRARRNRPGGRPGRFSSTADVRVRWPSSPGRCGGGPAGRRTPERLQVRSDRLAAVASWARRQATASARRSAIFRSFRSGNSISWIVFIGSSLRSFGRS